MGSGLHKSLLCKLHSYMVTCTYHTVTIALTSAVLLDFKMLIFFFGPLTHTRVSGLSKDSHIPLVCVVRAILCFVLTDPSSIQKGLQKIARILSILSKVSSICEMRAREKGFALF